MSNAGPRTEHVTILPPEQRNVLVVMIDHHMGNFVISLPVVHRLLSHFHEPPDLLVDERYLALARTLPRVGRVLGYPGQGRRRRGIVGNLRPMALMAGLALRRYRAVIDVSGGQRAAILSAATLARRRLGLDDSKCSSLYTDRTPTAGAVHAFDRYCRVLAAIGQERRPPLLRLRASKEAHVALQARLRENALPDGAPLAVIHPSAGRPNRRWPAERFAAVADEMAQQRGMSVCIIGAPGERELMDEVRGGMRSAASARCLVLPLDQLLALLERAAIVLSNESGPTHLAAMTEVPIVTLFGPSKEEVWRPIREDNTRVLRGATCDTRCGKRRCFADRRCLLSLEAREMAEAAHQLLDAPHQPVAWADAQGGHTRL